MDLAMIILLVIDGLLLVGILVSACIPRKSNKVNEELHKNNKSDDTEPEKEVKDNCHIEEEKNDSEENSDDNNEVVLDNDENLVAVSVDEKSSEDNNEVEKALEDIDAKALEDKNDKEVETNEPKAEEEPKEEIKAEEEPQPEDNTENIDEEDIDEAEEDEEEDDEEDDSDADENTEVSGEGQSTDNMAKETEIPEGRLGFLDIKHSLVPRKTFSERILASDERVILYYNEIRNQFKSYRGINARISKRCDSFRKGRELIAKILFSGKTMKIYLKLNPDNFPVNIYHHKNAGDKKSYREVPMMLKIKSDRAYKNVINLIDEMMIKLEVLPKAKYTDVNYVEYIKNLQNLE